MNFKKNWPLFVGLALPIIMILALFVIIYLPGSFIKPKYNFIYSTTDYYDSGLYFVVNGKLVENKIDCAKAEFPATCEQDQTKNILSTKLYLYDFQKEQSLELTATEAQKYTLNNNSESPDGYQIQDGRYRNNGIFELFGTNNNENKIMVRGQVGGKVINNLLLNDRYYSFKFIGWLIK
jgi:hypothetical protein